LHDTYLKGFIDMHIIFGDAVKEIPDSFTVLELDTFKTSNGDSITAYCVVEKIPLAEFAKLEAHKNLHADLMQYYRKQQWDYCQRVIEELIGKWNGEVDSFYTNLAARINELKHGVLDSDWDGVILKED
jgi:hypothetical protein